MKVITEQQEAHLERIAYAIKKKPKGGLHGNDLGFVIDLLTASLQAVDVMDESPNDSLNQPAWYSAWYDRYKAAVGEIKAVEL